MLLLDFYRIYVPFEFQINFYENCTSNQILKCLSFFMNLQFFYALLLNIDNDKLYSVKST